MDPNQMIGTFWMSKFSGYLEHHEICLIVGIINQCPVIMTNNQFYNSSTNVDGWMASNTKWRLIR